MVSSDKASSYDMFHLLGIINNTGIIIYYLPLLQAELVDMRAELVQARATSAGE